MSSAGTPCSDRSTGNLAGDEYSISESNNQSQDSMQQDASAHTTGAPDSQYSPLGEVYKEFLKVEEHFRLAHEGPQNSSDELLMVYFDIENPLVARSGAVSPSGLPQLDPALSGNAQAAFRKFVKIAARSCAWLSRSAASVEDLQTAYLSIVEGLGGLQDSLKELPSDDVEWPTAPQRIPSLLVAETSPHGETGADVTLCDLVHVDIKKSHVAKPIQVASSVPPASPGELFDLFPPLFPLRTVTLPADSEELVVPTSDPREVEYPFMIEYSIESRLCRRVQ
ncbi:hypothetical protein C2E23DRAFT_768539 [Lenzites betulinus]|nr:hypothetical protein C2E23DRAFT_768539 [Lenzites betulinus]